jgi:tetratricopeptide (TPR) repeat protein
MSTTDPQNVGARLDSWKEIAAFFARDERTVKRWEKERRLPVHRVPGGGRCTVFAYSDELKTWMRSSATTAAVDIRSDKAPAADLCNSNGHSLETHSLNGNRPNPDTAQSRFPGLGSPLMQYSLSEKESAWTDELDRPSPYSQALPPSRGHRLFAIAVVLLLGALFVAGGWRYVEIRSVQGYLLPSVGLRHPSEARKLAEEFYLQGRFYWSKRTPEGLTEAADYFTKSSQADPNYAPAYVGIADSYNLLREYTSMSGSQAFPLSLAASRKALELDPTLPEAHRALAFAEFNWEWNIPAAEREYQRAIELNPKDPLSHHWYATMLLGLDRLPESLAQIEQARKLDPTSAAIAADRAAIIAASGHTAEAISQLQALEAADPKFKSPHAYLARIYFQNKQYDKYFTEARELAALSHDQKAMDSISALQKAFLKNGGNALLEAMLQEQVEEFRQGRGDAMVIAATDMALGRNSEAEEYLEKSYQRHEYELINLRSAWEFFPLHDDPAFQDLLRRLKLRGNLGS